MADTRDVEFALVPSVTEQHKEGGSTKEVLEKETDMHHGLTNAEYAAALEKYGKNEVVTYEDPEWIKVMTRYFGLIPIMMLVVALLSACVVTRCDEISVVVDDNDCHCTEGRDWISFGLLIFELNLIVWVDYLGEASSGNAIKELKKISQTTSHVKRDGEWVNLPKNELVPGDIVGLVIGAAIPADGILRGDGPAEKFAPMKIDSSSVTGEPLPETKRVGDSVLAGTTVLSGELEMQVTRTGEKSSLGETMRLIADVGEKGGKLKTMLRLIANSVTLFAAIFCIGIFFVVVMRDQAPVPQAIKLSFVILVAVLPVAMPVVVTTGLSVGAFELSKDKAIVQRLSAIEEMAGMDILCSDKTGTLTFGRMSVKKDHCVPFGQNDLSTLLLMSLLSSRRENTDAIDSAVCNAFGDPAADANVGDVASPAVIKAAIAPFQELHFDPFSPLTKRVTATVLDTATGKKFIVAKGAPEIMNELPGIDADTERKANRIVDEKSAMGMKTLGVCRSVDDGESWEMIGYLSIADAPRDDSATTIKQAKEYGVSVKMITGDQRLIAAEICRQLDMGKNVFGPDVWLPNNEAVEQAGGIGKLVEMADGFASVKPKQKHRCVTSLQEMGHTVGMTGDGVNDAPALKVANVGIAVQGATDAARGAADLVLTEPGLSTIVKAINRSRMIFRRLEAYIIYRLASSVTILGFFVLSICALGFDFPTWCLILLSIINDFTVMATSKDNVRSSNYPLYWDLKKLCWKSFVIGGTCVIQSFLMLYFTRKASYSDDYGVQWIHSIGLGNKEDCEIVAIIYLTLAISIQLNIFSARNSRFFWQTSEESDAAPAPALLISSLVFGACILSTFIAVYWDATVSLGGGNPMKGCGWAAAGAVWLWCLIWFMIVELFKVAGNNLWEVRDASAGDLFFSPVTRNFFRSFLKKNQKEESADTGVIALVTSALMDNSMDSSTRGGSNSYQESSKMTTSVASVMNAVNDNTPIELSQMKKLQESTEHPEINELIKVVNAMRQHILNLEVRLRDVDGYHVAEKRLSYVSNSPRSPR